MNKKLCVFIALAGLSVAGGLPVHAQGPQLWIGGVGDYTSGSNWENGFSPAGDIGEFGVINNDGTAFVDEVVDPFLAPGGMILGEAAGDGGTLEIRSGGNLPVVMGVNPATGAVTVGQAGEGHLTVQRGGTLSSISLSSGGSSASSITLGQTGGAGTASVTVNGAANLNRTTRVVGPDVNFTANSLTLGAEHNLIAEITGANHSPLKTTGTASLGGTLTLDFNGHTPGPGDSWTLIDASNITGNFASVSSNATITEPGFGMFFETASGGMNGRIMQISVEARLLLSIDRTTGSATLNNLTTSESFDIDGYLITSESGALNPGGWSSFEDDGQANWRESNPGSTHLGELNLQGSRALGGGASVDLGNIYSPSGFNADEDLAFEYHVAGGARVEGLIEYTGLHNNLVLIVDPDTGEAALQNQSTFDIDIDGYLITSASNALNPDGWNGLGGDWRESNPAPNHIGELNLTGATELGGRSAPLSLGTLFDVNDPMAEQDLTFEFHMAGGETMMGIVEYGDIPDGMTPGIAGDFNNNGLVEQQDLDLVLANWGDPAASAPPTWSNDPPEGNIDQTELDKVLVNWGNTSGLGLAGSAAVPEPATWILLVAAASLAILVRRSS